MDTKQLRRALAGLGLTGLLTGGLTLSAAAPASARPDPGQPVPATSAELVRTVVREVEIPTPFDDGSVEPAQIALGALGGAALTGAAVLIAGTGRRTRQAPA